MNDTEIRLRPAQADDLEALNQVVADAIATWDLPERVKRLALPSYSYQAHDLEHLELLLAEASGEGPLGVAAWEPADPADAPPGSRALLLHGLYVRAAQHRRGIGSRLLAAAERAAEQGGFDGLLVKAQPGAEGFFAARGLERLAVLDRARDYPHRFWKPLPRAVGDG